MYDRFFFGKTREEASCYGSCSGLGIQLCVVLFKILIEHAHVVGPDLSLCHDIHVSIASTCDKFISHTVWTCILD